MLIHSSAAAERAFSILQTFMDTQENMLEDMKALSVMLRYNKQE
jgi:hypothetical protein